MIQALTVLWLIAVGALLANLGTVLGLFAAGPEASPVPVPVAVPIPEPRGAPPPIPKKKHKPKPPKLPAVEPPRPEKGLCVRWLPGKRSRVPNLYYIDEDQCDERLARMLRAHKLEVLTAYEAGNRGAEDLFQLKFATARRMVVITCDKHFRGMHSRGVVHSGIIHCPKGSEWFPEVLRVALRLSLETAEV